MNEPYTSPTTDPSAGIESSFDFDEAVKKRNMWRRIIRISIAGVIIPALIGLIGIVVGMLRAFGSLEESNGSADPSVLAKNISTSILSGFYSSLVSAVALIVLIVATFKYFGLRKSLRKHEILLEDEG